MDVERTTSHRLRVLFLDANVRFMNPTRNLWPAVLRSAAETDFFGPGYTSSHSLSLGLEWFMAEREPYDFVLASEHVLFSDAASWSIDNYTRSYGLAMPVSHLETLPNLLESFSRLSDSIRVTTLMESDFYNFSPWQTSRVDAMSDLVVGWGEQFVLPVNELPWARPEAFPVEMTDTWATFARLNRDRILPLPHFVGSDDFASKPMSRRPYDLVVPGARYASREALREGVSESASIRTLRLAGRAARWTAMKTRSQRVVDAAHGLSRWSYQRELFNAKSAFADGSQLKYPVRKFFEIPAAGALLLCEPCSGFEDLGFIDQVNCSVEPVEELIARGGVPRVMDVDRQAVASAGQDMVAEKHSLEKRSRQLRDALILMLAGHFQGARWDRGELIENSTGRLLG